MEAQSWLLFTEEPLGVARTTLHTSDCGKLVLIVTEEKLHSQLMMRFVNWVSSLNVLPALVVLPVLPSAPSLLCPPLRPPSISPISHVHPAELSSAPL